MTRGVAGRLHGHPVRAIHALGRDDGPAVAVFELVFDALNRAEVRYVAVGGFAVVVHGYARLTAALDLAVDLSPGAARKAVEALGRMGLRPRLPVNPFDFTDPEVRRVWHEERHMEVLSFWDPDEPMRSVDLFVQNPIEFEELWRRSETVELATVTARVASIEDIIRMKEISDRPQDRTDVEALRAILERRGGR